MRTWIVLHFQIIASVSLPGEMFQPSTGTQTSLLVMRKRKEVIPSLKALNASALAEPIFLSVPRRIGHDQRGAFIPLRDGKGDIVLRQVTRRRYFRDIKSAWQEETFEESEAVPDDELPKVLSDFRSWLSADGVGV